MNYYKSIWDTLAVKQGDKIYLSSDIIKLAVLLRHNNQKFSCNLLLDELIRKVGENGTILIPTFNWDIKDGDTFDIRKTKGTTGVLGNEALKMGFVRTKNPMHSFAVWGKDSAELSEVDNDFNFGDNSPFSYCLNEHVMQIMLGTDYSHSMTFIHYVEARCNVPYRREECVDINYIKSDGIKEVKRYRRKVHKDYGAIEKFNRIGKILEDKGISEKKDFYGITNYCIDLNRSYDIIQADIINNQCRNLFDFKIDREVIFGKEG